MDIKPAKWIKNDFKQPTDFSNLGVSLMFISLFLTWFADFVNLDQCFENMPRTTLNATPDQVLKRILNGH